ncbi:chalcone isomerase family protein [Dechloromonas sp. A34]|uniref:chalcone isomerase family protein n=1 Tax=Dechloromonas sp. A34 TaxID=447588 RepID=UPI00224997FA|nr:chalcone isomerase family protein [Dechloromonas sp. A34]
MITSHSVRRVVLIAALIAVPGLQAAEVAGVKVEEKLKVGGSELVLNGAGLRSKLFIKVYVGALYVGQKSTMPAGVYDSTAPRRMVMRMLRDMDAESLHGALDDGLKNNLTPAELAELKPQADQLATIMKGIGKVREGDSIAIDFTSEGVGVSLNGESRGKVAGANFAKALLRVWLGDKPADASLKKALLGS